MFEDSTFASASRIHKRSSRYAASSLVLQTALLATLVLLPYLYPSALPRKLLSVALIAPPPATAVPIVEPHHAIASTATRSEFFANMLVAPRQIPNSITTVVDPGPPGVLPPGAFSSAGPGALPLGPALPPAAPRVHAKPNGPIHVSSGVAAGQLIAPIRPRYPVIAMQARVQGTVVISAQIGTNGRIEGVQVLSGPNLLVPAAVDAVRQARYRPWTLNGDPAEVETTINIVFSLGDTSSHL